MGIKKEKLKKKKVVSYSTRELPNHGYFYVACQFQEEEKELGNLERDCILKSSGKKVKEIESKMELVTKEIQEMKDKMKHEGRRVGKEMAELKNGVELIIKLL